MTYNESGVTIAWQTAASGPPAVEAPAGERLESRPIGCNAPTVGYHVYEVAAEQSETRLTDKPLAGSPFVDRGSPGTPSAATRCGRSTSIGALSVESEPAPAGLRHVDRYVSARGPEGLVAVASEGAINLIWDANTEKDLAGYVVLRAPASTKEFTR